MKTVSRSRVFDVRRVERTCINTHAHTCIHTHSTCLGRDQRQRERDGHRQPQGDVGDDERDAVDEHGGEVEEGRMLDAQLPRPVFVFVFVWVSQALSCMCEHVLA